ncbi:MAG: transglutaminase-like domain-containing protein, partial [Planctomycetes bacterium]|nr:transglutaminase-like domain-containing protein [Planctomycetota bacterium]
ADNTKSKAVRAGASTLLLDRFCAFADGNVCAGRQIMRRIQVVPFIGTLLLLHSAWGQFDAPREPGGIQLDKPLTQRWQVGVIIQASGGPSAGLFGTLPIPTDWPEQKVRVVEEDVSPLVSATSYRELDGVRQMLFKVPRLPAGETAQALVTLEITKSSVLPPEHPEGLEIPRSVPRDVRGALGVSPGIECRDAKIRAKVKEIVEGKESAWEQVEAIYDWVRNNIAYRDGKEQGAAAALHAGFGNKHDLTSLFIALCRAHKVPARTVWVPDHVYAEFYLVGDEGEGHWLPCQVAGPRDFGSLSDNRPILQKGDNIRVPEERAPQRFVPEYLTGKGAGSPRVEFVRKLLPAN